MKNPVTKLPLIKSSPSLDSRMQRRFWKMTGHVGAEEGWIESGATGGQKRV